MSDLRAEFVEFLPERLADGVIYVSIEHATAAHLCGCGCRLAVYTPLSPTDWRMIYDGETVSLHPSIGNWSFPCRSHYWVERGRLRWAEDWSPAQIARGRARDAVAKQAHFERAAMSAAPAPKAGLLVRLRAWLRRA